MEAKFMMQCTEGIADVYIYNIGNRVITLNKKLVDRFSENVCSVDEKYIESGIKIFGTDKDDELISSLLSADMAQDLYDYKA